MAEFDAASRDALVTKIHELQNLVDSLRQEINRNEVLDFQAQRQESDRMHLD